MTVLDPIATLRRRIPDPEGVNQHFSDDDLNGFLEDNDQDDNLALADAFESYAGYYLLLFPADVTSDDGKVAHSAMAKEFRARAAALRQAALDAADLANSDTFFVDPGEVEW